MAVPLPKCAFSLGGFSGSGGTVLVAFLVWFATGLLRYGKGGAPFDFFRCALLGNFKYIVVWGVCDLLRCSFTTIKGFICGVRNDANGLGAMHRDNLIGLSSMGTLATGEQGG